MSDIPFAGPIGAVRVGRINGEFIANPTHSQRERSDLNLVYAGTEDQPIMIEGEAKEMPEGDFVAALHFAQAQVAVMVAAQRELAAHVNKVKREMPLFSVRDALNDIAYTVAGDRIEGAIYNASKAARGKAVGALKNEVKGAILTQYPDATPFEVSQAFENLQKKAFRRSILEHGKRADGRATTDLRALSGEVGLLPRSHGSALFARGETQALALATLASAQEAQQTDAYTGGESKKRFILHYNFPPFSVNETGRTGSPGRREIGHGALAERSIEAIVPPANEFPYAIRISSEIMESNGSTSMASVCAGCLALMDAGVPIKRPVAGISVGLVTEFANPGDKAPARYAMLTDIIGSEDHYGDMDFKLCGTDVGVTGFQLDLKLPGVSLELLTEGVHRAKESRTKILEVMHGILAQPRKEMSQYAPRIETVKINPDKIGLIIGPGGKTIKSIVAETGCEINIEDDGSINIYSNNGDAMARARDIINGMTKELEIGTTYDGRVVSIKEFGCFVEVLPGKEGLVHISELADRRVNRTEDVVRVGDTIPVKCIGIDEKGRVKFSRRAAMRDRDAAMQGASAPDGGMGNGADR